MLVSHSLQNIKLINNHLEGVVCDYCGCGDTVSLGHLPEIKVPMHRIGAAALDLDSNQINFVECAQCGFIYMNPRLTNSAIQLFYDTVYATSGASTQFESHQRDRANYILDTTENLLRRDNPSILDIGCGGGQLLKIAQERGWHIAGSEVSSVAAENASQKLSIQIHHGDFRDMNHGHYDVITMKSVVEHLREPMNYLQAAVNLLNPGGILFFNVPNYNSWERHIAQLTNQLWRGFIIEHLYYFTPDLIHQFAKDLNVDVLRMNSWVNNLHYPNPLKPFLNKTSSSEKPEASNKISIPIDHVSQTSLAARILAYGNQLILDIVAAASNGNKGGSRCNGNALFIWLQKPL